MPPTPPNQPDPATGSDTGPKQVVQSSPAGGFQMDPQDRQEQMLNSPLPALRADLLMSPQLYQGKTVYVIKDPITLNYYRLQPAEHFAAQYLDGKTTAKELAKIINQRFPEQTTSGMDVMTFVHMLRASGLLVGAGESHGK
ncbi:MAG: PqqD family protein, partial [Planctomycetota bacterium]